MTLSPTSSWILFIMPFRRLRTERVLRRYLLPLALTFALFSPGCANLSSTSDRAGSPSPQAQSNSKALEIKLPLQSNSVRFAVIGDSKTGEKEQYSIAEKMEAF